MISAGERFVPGRLWSLSDMLNQLFGPFYYLMGTVKGLVRNSETRAELGKPLDDEDMKIAMETLTGLKNYTADLELKESCKRIERIKTRISADNPAYIAQQLKDLLEIIEDEAEHSSVFHVPAQKAQLLRAEPWPWQPVIDKFPSTFPEIMSALYCHMIYEDTACVFHMMRVLEGGIAALAQDVGRKFARQNWQNIIDEIESEITTFRKTGPNTAQKAERLKFLSVAAKELFYFKDGWRNYVAHNRIRYDEHQAISVLEHVRAFMLHLSGKLSE
jgi:hypothetical protein